MAAHLTREAGMAKNFGVVNGRVISCAEAAQYRDTVLIRQYDAMIRDYDAGKEERIKKALAELSNHIASAEQAWKTAGATLRKRMYGQMAALAVAAGAKATAGWATSRQGLTALEKEVAGEMYERSTYFTEKISSAAYTAPDIDPVDIAQMGASLIIAVVGTPVMSAALFGAGLAYGGIQGWGMYSDYVATQAEYEGDVATLRRSIETIAARSVDKQVTRLIGMANDIAGTCG
jgi:hypothetical protein